MCDSGWVSDSRCCVCVCVTVAGPVTAGALYVTVAVPLLWVTVLLLNRLIDCGCRTNSTNRLWMTQTALTDCGCDINSTKQLCMWHKQHLPNMGLTQTAIEVCGCSSNSTKSLWVDTKCTKLLWMYHKQH
jgi:hypothetical protein